MAMAGTKSDLVDKTAVSIERITKIAKDLDAPFALVSAKTGEGVEELFKLIVDRLRKA
jgi:Ni2+-binding GTPase involved in maturation of urease and hydrogenase